MLSFKSLSRLSSARLLDNTVIFTTTTTTTTDDHYDYVYALSNKEEELIIAIPPSASKIINQQIFPSQCDNVHPVPPTICTIILNLEEAAAEEEEVEATKMACPLTKPMPT